ncbi:hypothetical protein Aut01nite_25230 [Actinoplanes utahensis]|nr:hypothetical protein Aut01nite_25230 [Actinoplanes utahensis]
MDGGRMGGRAGHGWKRRHRKDRSSLVALTAAPGHRREPLPEDEARFVMYCRIPQPDGSLGGRYVR